MTVGIVDIGICNLRSVEKAVDACGFDVAFVRKPSDLARDIDRVILPGVGSFRLASEALVRSELMGALRDFAARGAPLLGICLGMQLLATAGEEGGESSGLDLVPGRVVRLSPPAPLRVPHVGWNTVDLRSTPQRDHAMFRSIKKGRDFYFVHSYHLVAANDADVLGRTEHGQVFTSVVARGSVVGVQFHPEKSQVVGMTLLESFLRWTPT